MWSRWRRRRRNTRGRKRGGGVGGRGGGVGGRGGGGERGQLKNQNGIVLFLY